MNISEFFTYVHLWFFFKIADLRLGKEKTIQIMSTVNEWAIAKTIFTIYLKTAILKNISENKWIFQKIITNSKIVFLPNEYWNSVMVWLKNIWNPTWNLRRYPFKLEVAEYYWFDCTSWIARTEKWTVDHVKEVDYSQWKVKVVNR